MTEVDASIDESDVGRVKEGHAVSFHIDAYPDETFTGKVLQVRLNPTVNSKVVTYTAVIDAPNANVELKPGTTASMVRECSAGLLKFGYVYFTMPRHNRGLVVSASFSNEREE